MKTAKTIMAAVIMAMFIVATFMVVTTYAQTCETRCISKDLVTGECNVWVTDCWDNQ